MTKHEAAVISAFTGYMIGNFADMHEYAEQLFGERIFTHQFANEGFVAQFKKLATPDFMKINEEII